MTTFADLIGINIVAAKQKHGDLFFVLDTGEVISFVPYGDCCASCYVQHVSGADALKNATLNRVDDLELPEVPPEEANDVSDVWGHSLITSRGYCTIEMRVDHNGYYGGELTISRDAVLPKDAVDLDDF